MLHAAPVVNLELHDSIKRRLRARKITLRSIAEEAGCGISTVTMVCQGHRRSPRIEALISGALGLTPQLLWPERYWAQETEEEQTTN